MTTPDAVMQYLADMNVNSLLKSMTTELVIHKPDDPVAFIHNLTKLIMSEPDYAYSAERVEQMITDARKKSEEDVEAEAKLLNQSATPQEMEHESDQRQIRGLNQDFSRIVGSMRSIAAELDPKKAAHVIAEQTKALLHCEAAILFTYDAETDAVTANSEQSPEFSEKPFPVKQSLIGRCVKSGDFAIVSNVADDANFDSAIDNILGIELHNVLLCPIKDFDTSEVYGLIAAMNKTKRTDSTDSDEKQKETTAEVGHNGEEFSEHDVDLLEALGTIGQITLQNGIIYGMASAEKIRNEAMLSLWSHLNDSSKVYNIHSLLFTITRRCLAIVNAEKCTFYFVDHQNKELWSIQGELNIRMPIDKGLAGQCATSGEIVNEENVYKNEQFNKGTDEKTGFVTQSMLCVPMKDSEGTVIGVIQLINKQGIIPAFDQNDEQILALVLSAASPIVQQNQLFFVKSDTMKGKVAASKDEKFVSDLSEIKVARVRRKSIDRKGGAGDIGDLIEEEELAEVAEEQEEDKAM